MEFLFDFVISAVWGWVVIKSDFKGVFFYFFTSTWHYKHSQRCLIPTACSMVWTMSTTSGGALGSIQKQLQTASANKKKVKKKIKKWRSSQNKDYCYMQLANGIIHNHPCNWELEISDMIYAWLQPSFPITHCVTQKPQSLTKQLMIFGDVNLLASEKWNK